METAAVDDDKCDPTAGEDDVDRAVREVGEEGGSRFITLQIQLPKSTDSCSCSERLMKGWF